MKRNAFSTFARIDGSQSIRGATSNQKPMPLSELPGRRDKAPTSGEARSAGVTASNTR